MTQENVRLKTLHRLAVRDKASAERQAADLARQLAEIRSAAERTADTDTLPRELEMMSRPQADELTRMQTRLHDLERERSQLREALQLARAHLAVLESAAQVAGESCKKKAHFEFAAMSVAMLAIASFLTALVLGGLLSTTSGREVLGRLLAQTNQMSLQ